MLNWSKILVTAIIIVFHILAIRADTNEGTTSSTSHNDSTDSRPQPNLNPDPEQTQKAIETIQSSSRQDILVWRTELSETQKYFNKLREQNTNEERMSGNEDPVFRQWAEKTEERMSKLFGAMDTRLSQLETNAATT